MEALATFISVDIARALVTMGELATIQRCTHSGVAKRAKKCTRKRKWLKENRLWALHQNEQGSQMSVNQRGKVD